MDVIHRRDGDWDPSLTQLPQELLRFQFSILLELELVSLSLDGRAARRTVNAKSPHTVSPPFYANLEF